jgi:hypothetical protein
MQVLLTAILGASVAIASDAPMTNWAGVETAQSWSCQPRKTCGRIGSCDEARWYLNNCSWGGKLDRDGDGIPCESIC